MDHYSARGSLLRDHSGILTSQSCEDNMEEGETIVQVALGPYWGGSRMYLPKYVNKEYMEHLFGWGMNRLK